MLSGNLKVWSDSPFNFLSSHNALQLCNVSRYSLKKMQNLAQVQNGRLAPPMRQDAYADGAKRPEAEKLIIVYGVGFFHQLHIAS